MEYVAVSLVEGDLTFLSFPQHSWSQPMSGHCILGSKCKSSWFSTGVPTALGQIDSNWHRGLLRPAESKAPILSVVVILLYTLAQNCPRKLKEIPCQRRRLPALTAPLGQHELHSRLSQPLVITSTEESKRSLLSVQAVLLVSGPKDQTYVTLKVLKCN